MSSGPATLSDVLSQYRAQLALARSAPSSATARELSHLSGAILLRLQQPLSALVSRMHRRGTLTAEDLEQRAFLVILEQLPDYDPARGKALWSWLYPIVFRALAREIRRQRADVHLSDHDAAALGPTAWPEVESVMTEGGDRLTDEPGRAVRTDNSARRQSRAVASAADEQTTALQELMEAEGAERLQYALARLPPQMGTLIRRAYGIGRPAESVRDIARSMGIPEGSRARIARLVERALKMLRDELAE